MSLVGSDLQIYQGEARPATRDRERGSYPRSSYGQIPGAELPGIIYGLIVAAYAWMLLVAWVAFSRSEESEFNLSFTVVLGLVFFALPIILQFVARRRARLRTTDEALPREIEVATGWLSAREAFLQVLLIPFALALAATMIGTVDMLVR